MAEFESCENCIHDSKGLEDYPCNECTHNAQNHFKPIPKQTNADRIRSMSDEELAEFINKTLDNSIQESNEDICDFCTAELCDENGCIHATLEWLQSEVIK